MTDSPVTGFKAKIPNILTIGRIVLIPVLVWGILQLDVFSLERGHPHMGTVVLILFVLMALTDFLDGFFARKWQVTSDFGRMIDPIADKLFVAGCLIAICIVSIGAWLVLVPALLIIGRDIFVSGLREHAALKSRTMPPTKLAKWKTACEMLAIFVLLLSLAMLTFRFNHPSNSGWVEYPPLSTDQPSLHAILLHIGIGVLWIAALLSVYTGSLYLRAALKD
ncbi:MAG: CDP-diacylglycerol--glycerol-3-phosphate 3-phosphatidyltransferase [Hellea sp.]|nr:CDP-diacylglycerol--glycerol-3-phosphate 3-phosphatidyltransferase [Hellea sp.]